LRGLVMAFTGLMVLVLVVGTVVTGSGPHAGDATSARYPFVLDEVAKVHSGLVWLTTGLLVVVLVALRRSGADRRVFTRAVQVAAVVAAQAVIGVMQFRTERPAALVSLHVLGAVVLWAATLRLLFATRTRA